MSTDTPDASVDDAPSRAELAARVNELEDALAEATSEDDAKKMSIISTKGTLDMAYPPLILASTAAAFGYEVTVFHTFWGWKSSTRNVRRTSNSVPSATPTCLF